MLNEHIESFFWLLKVCLQLFFHETCPLFLLSLLGCCHGDCPCLAGLGSSTILWKGHVVMPSVFPDAVPSVDRTPGCCLVILENRVQNLCLCRRKCVCLYVWMDSFSIFWFGCKWLLKFENCYILWSTLHRLCLKSALTLDL